MSGKTFVYELSKRLGLFHLARWVTRRELRILCYHGFSLADEDAFRAKLFIRSATFARRMQYLAHGGVAVLPLDEAIRRLRDGTLPDFATVITIDDGLYSVYRAAMPVLARHGFSATVYVTSYYVAKQTPVFRLAVQYMFWKTERRRIDVAGLIPEDADGHEIDAGDAAWMWRFIEHGEQRCDEPRRCQLSAELGRRLGVDYGEIAEGRLFSLMDENELRELLANGIDIQLHTHRHRFPPQRDVVARELEENESCLRPLVGRRMRHFCYPSGEWSPQHWPWLASYGVESATTCEPGFNTAATPPFAMGRFLDGENISQIEFEAEVCGFSEMLRQLRRRVTGKARPLEAGRMAAAS
jgi:peptidoglycan/xylan/chitin deacetylase (PgdA/CDA1 family)